MRLVFGSCFLLLGTVGVVHGFVTPPSTTSKTIQRFVCISPPRRLITSSSTFSSDISSRLMTAESSESSSSDDSENEAAKTQEAELVEVDVVDDDETVPKWKRILLFYKYNENTKNDDGLTFRQRLAKAGLSVVLSYGFVSNMSYCVSVSIAWYIFSKRTMLSPLAPGQWPKFLAVYSGFWVFNNIVRPLRFGLSVAISTKFDKVVQWIQDKARVNRGVAIGLTVFVANFIGTLTFMCLGISLAASLAGVPIWSGK